MPLAVDLLHSDGESERRCHKQKRLVPTPNSFFMDVKCPSCFTISTLFSHAQTVVRCRGCSGDNSRVLGGKTRLVDGCSFRRKPN
ncbi:hypothetical protein M3Y94_01010200 [Aphelenchoides besseyi]|nr:hypothetical protein M3Y94_01010200 [Aphelenchoides besseyi]